MKILLIDDDKDSNKMMKEALEPGGHECTYFHNPFEGIAAYKDNSFDTVVTDYKMPGLNGIEVLKRLKEYDKDAVVIVLTGYADIDNAINAINNGAYAFFRKPLDIKEFIMTLDKIEDELSGKLKKEADISKLYQEYKKLKNSFESLKELIEKLTVSEKEKVINE